VLLLASIPPEIQQLIVQLEQLRQQYQIVQSQRLTLESRQSELKNAISELESSEEKFVYKSIGAILVKRPKDKVLSELKEELELIGVRINAVKKQEQSLMDKIKALESKIKSIAGAQRNVTQ